MRRAEIMAKRSRRSWARSSVVFLALHKFFGETVEELQWLSRASVATDSVRRLTQPPLQLFRSLRGYLLERLQERSHL